MADEVILSMLKQISTGIENLNSEVKVINKRLEKIEERLTKLEESVARLEQKVEKLEKEFSKLKDRFNRFEVSFYSLRLFVEKLDEKYEKINYTMTIIEIDHGDKMKIMLDALCSYNNSYAEFKKRFVKNEKLIEKNSQEIYLVKSNLVK